MKTTGKRRLRASEKVLRYLEAEFRRDDLEDGSRLPTMRELAGQTGVSLFTVQTVIQKLQKEGRIRTEAGSGTFLVSRRAPARDTVTIGMDVPPDCPARQWSFGITNGILAAAAVAQPRVMIHPLAPQSAAPDALSAAIQAAKASLDALILFASGYPWGSSLISGFEADNIPVVVVNPPAAFATENFVTADHYTVCRQLAQAWRRCGRRRILMLTHAGIEFTTSSEQRYLGLATGLQLQHGNAATLTVLACNGIEHEDARQALRRYLQTGSNRPDAVFCTGDMLAHGAMQSLEEAGLRVPADVSVVGGTGLDISIGPGRVLTRIRQPMAEIGRQAVAMALRRLIQDCQSAPGIVLPAPLAIGNTTTPEENALLSVG